MRYGLEQGDLRARDLELSTDQSQFQAVVDDERYAITTHLLGTFNVYNCLAAIGVARAAGLSKQQIEQGITSLKSVDGRMNSVEVGQDFTVIVDYACTPVGFEEVFATVEPLAQQRIITVFGSPGRQDTLKLAHPRGNRRQKFQYRHPDRRR